MVISCARAAGRCATLRPPALHRPGRDGRAGASRRRGARRGAALAGRAQGGDRRGADHRHDAGPRPRHGPRGAHPRARALGARPRGRDPARTRSDRPAGRRRCALVALAARRPSWPPATRCARRSWRASTGSRSASSSSSSGAGRRALADRRGRRGAAADDPAGDREGARRRGVSRAPRRRVFLVGGRRSRGAPALGFAGLPDFGALPGPVRRHPQRVVVPERHVTAVVTAINFDYRGFDTLGEEFILFAAVLGVALLLRELRDEDGAARRRRARPPRARAERRRARDRRSRSWGRRCCVGLYVIVHGHSDAGRRLPGRRGPRHRAPARLSRRRVRDAARACGPIALIELAEALGRRRVRADRDRRADLLRAPLLRELPAAGHAGRAALGGNDPAAQRRRRARGRRRLRAAALRVPRADARGPARRGEGAR